MTANMEPLTLTDCSTRSGLAPSTLRRYVEGAYKPQLPARLFGKTWMVDPQEFETWLATYHQLPKRGRRK